MLPVTMCTLLDPANIHTAKFPTHPLTHTTELPEQCLSEVLLTSEGKMKHKINRWIGEVSAVVWALYWTETAESEGHAHILPI